MVDRKTSMNIFIVVKSLIVTSRKTHDQIVPRGTFKISF